MSTMLQGKSVDLEAAQEERVVINTKAERGDPSFWKEVHQRGNRLQLSLLTGPCMPRTTGR